jgi:CRISPR type II-A-associated protein Csn2
MKLVHQDWEKPVIMDNEKVPLISVENPQCLYNTLKELEEESRTGIGNFVLSEGSKILDMKKQFLFVGSPWDMDLNDRKLTTKLIACLIGKAQDETYYRKSEELCGAVQNWLEEITTEIPLPVAYDLDVDMEALFKALHVHLEEQGESLAERMLTFMKSWDILCGETGFAFYGFRNLLPSEERDLFYENAKEENLNFILIEGPCHDTIETEDLFIIDKDLCQIFE